MKNGRSAPAANGANHAAGLARPSPRGEVGHRTALTAKRGADPPPTIELDHFFNLVPGSSPDDSFNFGDLKSGT